MALQIVPATSADVEALAQVEIQSKQASFPRLLEPHDTDFTARVHRWQTYFAGTSPQSSRPPRITLKALDASGHIVGYLSGHLSRRFNMDSEIQSLYVLLEYQRKGLGSQLLLRFKQWLQRCQATSLCVGIHPQNPYRAFYVKHGATYLNEHWMHWPSLEAITI